MDPASSTSVAFGATTLLAGGVAALLAVLALWLFIQRQQLQGRLNSETEAREQLEQEAERLRPYAHVADSNKEATRLRRDFAVEAEQTIADFHTGLLEAEDRFLHYIGLPITMVDPGRTLCSQRRSR